MADVNSLIATVAIKTEDECVPNNVVRDSAGAPIRLANGSFLTSGEEKLDSGPRAAKSQTLPLIYQVQKNVLVSVNTPEPPAGIGRLNRLHIKAVMVMLAQAASGNVYNLITASNFVGKYQLSALTLSELGYIKPEYVVSYGLGTVKRQDAWTGKDGINNLETWFLSTGVQESAMYSFLSKNYISMQNNGAIKEDDNLCTIAGMLCVAHILGPDAGSEINPGAKRWRSTGGGTDANGNYASTYFLLGRYAIDVLAAPRTL
jgi:hypothetical protein